MKARRLIDGASYRPAVVKAMGQAFDAAWAEIAANYRPISNRGSAHQVGRSHAVRCWRGIHRC